MPRGLLQASEGPHAIVEGGEVAVRIGKQPLQPRYAVLIRRHRHEVRIVQTLVDPRIEGSATPPLLAQLLVFRRETRELRVLVRTHLFRRRLTRVDAGQPLARADEEPREFEIAASL